MVFHIAGSAVSVVKAMFVISGEWDPNTSLLAHRMKELQGRRAYLKNFWYAAGEQAALSIFCPITPCICSYVATSASSPIFMGLGVNTSMFLQL